MAKPQGYYGPMMKLNPNIFEAHASDYESARAHAQKLDQALGFRVEEVEKGLLEKARSQQPDGNHLTWGAAIHEGNQTWVGLSHQTLQTPYLELVHICNLLGPSAGELMADLGAGYGRLGLVLGVLNPEVNFLGLEYVPERVREGQRILEMYECRRASLLQQDLTAAGFVLPEADYYFLYDYGTVGQIRQTLRDLERIGERRKFKIIARGKGVRSLIHHEHLWLTVAGPIHQENFSIYSNF